MRLLGSVGEPINPEVWRWYHAVVGDGRCPIVDTWWQTETGGVLSFVGVKMLLAHTAWKLDTLVSLGVIVLILTVSVVWSLMWPKRVVAPKPGPATVA